MKSRPGQYLVYSLAGAAAIGALTFLLPLVDTGGSSAAAYVGAYAIVIASVAPLLHGLFLAARGQSTQVLLAASAAAAALGVVCVFVSSPENGTELLIADREVVEGGRCTTQSIGLPTFEDAVSRWFPLVDKPRTRPIEQWSEWQPDPDLLIQDKNADIALQ